MQGHLLYELCARSHAAVELRAIRQGRECLSEVACGVAVEVPLAAKPGPTGEDGEGDDLAFGEGWLGAGLPSWPMGLGEVVHHDVKCGKEGVHIDHKSSVPFPSGSVSKPTLVYGHLPLKSSTGNSHQAFKGLTWSSLGSWRTKVWSGSSNQWGARSPTSPMRGVPTPKSTGTNSARPGRL